MNSFQREAWWRWWLTPSELAFYDLNTVSEAGAFVSKRAWEKIVRPSLNDFAWMPLTDNKLIYGSYFHEWGIATPRSVGFLAPGRGFTSDLQFLGSISDLLSLLRDKNLRSFVMKPVKGALGAGVVIIEDTRWVGDDAVFITADGRELTQQELANELVMTYRRVSGYLIQERLPQHPRLRELSGAPSNSLRVVTWAPDGGSPAVQMAVAVLGRRGHMVGNWTHGGVAVGIDLESGELGRGHLRHSGWIDTHPDTGKAIAGRVPYWEETCALARDAALVTPGLRAVLWDAVITEAGPVFVEANSMWGIQLMQLHHGGFIGSAIGDAWARAGADLPDGSPRWRRTHWWKALRPPQGRGMEGAVTMAKDGVAAGKTAASNRLKKGRGKRVSLSTERILRPWH